LIAGVNAALSLTGKDFVLDRADGYIGVMIDDLVHLGTKEPYRMFTARAEYRVALRADNADMRLTQKGFDVGCVGEYRMQLYRQKKCAIDLACQALDSFTLSPHRWRELLGITIASDGIKRYADRAHLVQTVA
jgi:tRNA uridine 5-carboxymethylaminomethyl modification enzyme